MDRCSALKDLTYLKLNAEIPTKATAFRKSTTTSLPIYGLAGFSRVSLNSLSSSIIKLSTDFLGKKLSTVDWSVKIIVAESLSSSTLARALTSSINFGSSLGKQ